MESQLYVCSLITSTASRLIYWYSSLLTIFALEHILGHTAVASVAMDAGFCCCVSQMQRLLNYAGASAKREPESGDVQELLWLFGYFGYFHWMCWVLCRICQNLTCVNYFKQCLQTPSPFFSFTIYSLCRSLSLSLYLRTPHLGLFNR